MAKRIRKAVKIGASIAFEVKKRIEKRNEERLLRLPSLNDLHIAGSQKYLVLVDARHVPVD